MKTSIVAKTLALVLGMSMALVGCSGGGDTKTPSSTTPDSSKAAPSSQAEPAKVDPEAKFPETVTVKIAWPSNAATGPAQWDGHSPVDNPWTDLLLERYNIKIEMMWEATAADDQYKTKLNMAIASNQLPDIIHTANYSQFSTLVKNDKIEDLTPYYDTYTSDLVKGFIDQDGGLSQSYGVVKGKTMGLSTSQANFTAGRIVFIREDWMKELKVEAPKTMDDVITIAKKFADTKKGRFALPLFKKLSDDGMCDITGIANSVGAFPRTWLDDGKGNAVYGSTQPEMKKVLGIYADLYKGGYLDPAFASLDGGKVGEQLTSNKIGVIIGEQWLPTWPLDSLFEQDGVNWIAYPIMAHSSNASTLKVQARPPKGEMAVVRKGFSNPEALFKICNVVAEKFDDPNEKETYHSYLAKDGVTTVQVFGMNPLGFYYADNMTNFNTYKHVTDAIDKKDESLLISASDKLQYPKVKKYTDAIAAGTKPEKGDWVMSKLFYGEQSAYAQLTKYIEEDMYITDLLPGYQTETMDLQWEDLKLLEDQYFTEIISGTKELDKGFDEFVSTWKARSGDKIVTEVNDWYKAQK